MTLAELEAIGLSGRAVRHRLATGRLRRLHRGVYAIGSPTDEARWSAAVLVGGEGALLSHRSAAALWGLCDDDRTTVHVTLPKRATRVRPSVELHSGATFTDRDRAVERGIPCTAVPRTLLGLASQVDARRLSRAVDRAEQLRLFDLAALDELLDRSAGARGVAALRALLAQYTEPTVTRSEAEERFLALVKDARLPTPAVNAWIPLPDGGGYSPDFLWRDERLIVEVDGRAYHSRRQAFAHDRRRDRRLALAGFETRRYAASEVLARPRQVAVELRAFLHPRR
jgi:very-short-patch-repair endonuclease